MLEPHFSLKHLFLNQLNTDNTLDRMLRLYRTTPNRTTRDALHSLKEDGMINVTLKYVHFNCTCSHSNMNQVYNRIFERNRKEENNHSSRVHKSALSMMNQTIFFLFSISSF
jgi:hypothetical protein